MRHARDLREQIADYNSLDCELYRFVTEGLFADQVKQYGESLAHDEVLRSENELFQFSRWKVTMFRLGKYGVYRLILPKLRGRQRARDRTFLRPQVKSGAAKGCFTRCLFEMKASETRVRNRCPDSEPKLAPVRRHANTGIRFRVFDDIHDPQPKALLEADLQEETDCFPQMHYEWWRMRSGEAASCISWRG